MAKRHEAGVQFTRLRLNGFKSFVDPTELVISAGLTGVVGPNGCGKSNLLEALRWIMGENRPTQMRGDGMDDVIFAGSESRPARHNASVELIVDNSDRLAPAVFNKDDKLEVSRRITREIGSAYRINGKEVRARDVQMLFADASTGAHSPALVRQGQIAELINAKPKARRRVLEEAAGISGLYQRRHEAELKLRATEVNLARVEDVLGELGQRLASLERQAGQARRYRAIAEALRRAEAVALWLRWRAAEDERAAAEARATEALRAAAAAERAVREATAARETAAAALPPKREEEAVANAILQRLSHERDRLDEQEERARAEAGSLGARIRQLAQDVDREETLGRDAHATLDRLAEEEARLSRAMQGQDEAQANASETARAATESLSGEEQTLDRLNTEAARIAAQAQAAERRVNDTRAAGARLDEAIATAEKAVAGLAGEIGKAEADCAARRAETEAAQAAAEAAEAALVTAGAAQSAARETEAEARAALSDAEGETAALSAEAEALAKLTERDGGTGDGLLDGVAVEPGFEPALGAALGDDLDAGEAADASGWTTLEPYPASPPLPDGARPIGEVARGPALLARRFSQTGLVDREAGDALQAALGPGQRLVSREGDLWRWDGLRLRAGDAPSAAALRLAQRNRLARLRDALGKAERLRDRARQAHGQAKAALDRAAGDEAAARRARRDADAAQTDTARALNRAEAALALARSRNESQAEALTARRGEREAAAAALAEAGAALAELADPVEARRAVERQRAAVDAARTAMMAARSKAEDLRRAAAGRERRLAEVRRETVTWQDRRDNAGTRVADLTRRMDETRQRREAIADQPAALAASRDRLVAEIEKAESRRRAAADALAAAETALVGAEAAEREAEKAASARREERARLDAVLEGAENRAETAAQEIHAEMETDPSSLRDRLGGELPAPPDAEAEVAKLRRQRDALGAVNLRADLDADEVRAERDSLAAEKADLDEAVAKLRRGIAELNREGRSRITAAFETVNSRFAGLFRHLFGGGEARLVMVDSDDPLDAGLEILCQPPGKKLSTLSLLSGGEQTLTALSLIFAVFLANPAPICVLDEVDAPLDDSNVGRFCDLLDEMRRRTETRFLIITHHAITMSRMDRLFGVTMVERGVSQLVSVDLGRAAEMVDA